MANGDLKPLSTQDLYGLGCVDDKARALRALALMIEGDICKPRLVAALTEAAAILEDAAESCKGMPFRVAG
jgi:hypothetical protein